MLAGWQCEAEHPAASLAYWDAVALGRRRRTQHPPDIDWFAEVIADMTGRSDLTKKLLRESRPGQ